MGLEAVLDRIRDSGKEEADAIVQQGRDERERLLDEVRKEGERLRGQREEEARLQADRRRIQDLARAELDARKIVLAGQEEVLNAARARAQRLIAETSRADSLRRMLERHAAEWRVGRVYANERDADLVRSIAGGNFGGAVDCLGGIVIESRDGTTRLDLTYDSILRDLWPNIVKEVAQKLWPPS